MECRGRSQWQPHDKASGYGLTKDLMRKRVDLEVLSDPKKKSHIFSGSFVETIKDNYFAASSISFHSASDSFTPAAAIFSSRCATEEVPGIGNITGE